MNTATDALTIGKALQQAVDTMPSHIGYIFQDRRINYQEMDKLANRFASSLLNLGYQKGDRIGIISVNLPEWLIAYFGAAKIGVVIVGLNVRYRDTELNYMINQSQIRGIVSLASIGEMDYVSFFQSFKENIPTVEHFIFIGGKEHHGGLSFKSLLENEIEPTKLKEANRQVTPEDLIMIIYTSGTTGTPKGASMTHKSQLSAASTQAEHTDMSSADVIPIALPFNHVGGITCGVVANLLTKSTTVILPNFSPADFIQQCKLHQATGIGGVPMMHTLIINHPDFPKLDADKIKVVMTGGSNATPALLTKMYEAFPNAFIMNLYGLSEVSGGMVMSPRDSNFEQTTRSIGKPLGNFEAKVVGADGKTLPIGESGELCLKGDAVGAGYYRMPKETKEAFKEDGWLHTGDIAFIDEQGYITLKGRLKEMYIQGGYNVYPVEVENLLAKHPKVLLAAGIGIPDPIHGEIGRYYIIPQPNTSPTKEELVAYCAKELANYKIPKQIIFRKELPLTPAGKVMKSALKKEYEETL